MKSKMPSKGKAKPSSADELVKSSRKGHVELDEKELKGVTGGSLEAGVHYKYDIKAQKEA